MAAGGLLLTGGASRRMGQDKATLVLAAGGVSLARRSAAVLAGVTTVAIEVGPGCSGLPAVQEDPPGSGPLPAVVAGWRALGAAGWGGPVLVVATDLPRLTATLLAWLVGHPSDRSVVPVVDGWPQPICARYAPADLGAAADLVACGSSSMRDLLAVAAAHQAGPDEWRLAGISASDWADADTPEDLAVAIEGLE
jgi:molybdopterin-guanine dinucleotide biosynthesis protein A